MTGVALNHSNEGMSWREKLLNRFPDREFFMRSQGQVRFITITSRMQIGAASAAIALSLGWAGSMGLMAWNKYAAEANLASFQDEKAKVASARERLDAYGGDIDRVVEDLNTRQEALDQMVEMLPADIQTRDTNVTDSEKATAETVEQVSAHFPQARGLALIEARQLAFVENLTRFADWRAGRAEAALRKLNLDPRAMARLGNGSAREAMGGPLEALTTSADGSLDPRFERLGLSLERMAALERALDAVPQVVPAADHRITSSYGFRRDPFNGRGAMHKGIDFKGKTGSPIYAAAQGRVTFTGRRGGYGKTVEITHANGVMTRYAHLNRIDVKRGERIAAGATLGGLGSTGRSTGPHLHFEVRINGRAVNPRPFLETAPDVLKEVRGTRTTRARTARANHTSE
ncbi:MAG: peptidoglycan DD-metalloendopeptidase family protein [Erythrobacter sp.]|jgi:murein DD-endopeptidase MepM/ murein hydrolase activator NlpD|nr:peptidoglycan DD-metalloendopeptidase family protein [Erythrobacter sp.]